MPILLYPHKLSMPELFILFLSNSPRLSGQEVLLLDILLRLEKLPILGLRVVIANRAGYRSVRRIDQRREDQQPSWVVDVAQGGSGIQQN